MYWGCLVNVTCLAIQGFTQKCQRLVCFLIKCFTRKECPVAKFSLQGWTNLSVPSPHCYKQTLGEWIRPWTFKMEKETLLSIVCEFWPCTVKKHSILKHPFYPIFIRFVCHCLYIIPLIYKHFWPLLMFHFFKIVKTDPTLPIFI